jgi:toxin ParE1/3/4
VKLVWSPQAVEDLAALRAYIEGDDPGAARKTALRIVEAVETLIPADPKIGRPGRVSGTRELVIAHTPYIVPYRLRAGTIEVLRVFHGARRWPDRL